MPAGILWRKLSVVPCKRYALQAAGINAELLIDHVKAKLIVQEMTDLLVLDLVDKGLVTDQVVLTVGCDIENLTRPEINKQYKGAVTTDHYGRRVPKHAHGTANLNWQTSSTKQIMDATMDLYDRIIDKTLPVRRIYITVNHVEEESNSLDSQPL